MSWLLDDPTALYLFLGVFGLILLVLWWRGRDPRFLYGVGGVLLVVVLIWALGFFINTDGKQIGDRIKEMRAAVQRKDVDALFLHIADDFRVRSLDRKRFRDLVQQAIREGAVTDVVTLHEEPAKVDRKSRTQGTA